MATATRKGEAAKTNQKVGLAFYAANREGSRRIKLHDQNQDKGKSKNDAVVLTKDGRPDMRFAENRNLFERDTSKKINGEEDRRFLENRPDLLAVHESRGENLPNMIFTDDMMPDVGTELLEAAGA